jgi:tRNA pseudouridine55 synthase
VALKSRRVTVHSLTISSSPSSCDGEVAVAKTTDEGEAAPVLAPPLPFGRSPSPSQDDGEDEDSVTLSASVSKGTYIRSLARDIAYALGTVGHVTMLRRNKAGPFSLSHAISLDILFEKTKARALEDILLPLRTALDDIPALALTPEQARLIGNGRVLSGIAAANGLHLAMLDELPVALVNCDGGTVTVERGFNL